MKSKRKKYFEFEGFELMIEYFSYAAFLWVYGNLSEGIVVVQHKSSSTRAPLLNSLLINHCS